MDFQEFKKHNTISLTDILQKVILGVFVNIEGESTDFYPTLKDFETGENGIVQYAGQPFEDFVLFCLYTCIENESVDGEGENWHDCEMFPTVTFNYEKLRFPEILGPYGLKQQNHG